MHLPPAAFQEVVMDIFWLLIGIAVGLALAGIGVSGVKVLAWIEAKIKLVEAQTESHKADAAMTVVHTQVSKNIPSSVPAGPTKS